MIHVDDELPEISNEKLSIHQSMEEELPILIPLLQLIVTDTASYYNLVIPALNSSQRISIDHLWRTSQCHSLASDDIQTLVQHFSLLGLVRFFLKDLHDMSSHLLHPLSIERAGAA